MHAPHPQALDGRLSFLLGKLYLLGLDLESTELSVLELNVKQHAALAVLTDEGPVTQQELGQRMGIDRTTIVDVIDRLDELGVVERRRNPADRRANLLNVTPAGLDTYKKGAALVERAESALLAGLTEREQGTLRALLSKAVREISSTDSQ